MASLTGEKGKVIKEHIPEFGGNGGGGCQGTLPTEASRISGSSFNEGVKEGEERGQRRNSRQCPSTWEVFCLGSVCPSYSLHTERLHFMDGQRCLQPSICQDTTFLTLLLF